MADLEQLKAWRAVGVKEMSLDSKGEIAHVEFFPLSLLERADDLTEGATPEERSERDTEAPAAGPTIPRALQNLLKNGSVS